MANQLAYLVKRKSGRYYARFQKRDGRWSHESLGATKAAEAKVLFDQWKQRRLKAKKQEQEDIRPLSLAKLAEEHLRHVERHQAPSWHVKRRSYLENYVLFFGEKTLSTEVAARRIREYVVWRKGEGRIRSVTANT